VGEKNNSRFICAKIWVDPTTPKVFVEVEPTSETLAEIYADYLKHHIVKLAKSFREEVQFYV
jgi:hypothetical protein